MDIHFIMWIIFWVVIAIALFVDLVVVKHHHGKVSIKEASLMVAAWIALAALFGAAVWLTLGQTKALEFFTGYVIEYSLSIDNMFVFIMIFAYFAVPPENQPKVLIWGILGAVLMRFIFIFIGVQLITQFKFMIYIFGALLIYTAIKMLAHKEEEFDPSKMPVLKALKKIMPLKDNYHGENFFVKDAGKLFATPLFATVLVIETSDLIFAIDSIPAVLSITHDTFIVYTSNIFAIIGLRSLYFLLAGMAGKFEYLKYGIAAVLVFVGVKMLISHFYHFPTALSLLVIVVILTIAIAASVIRKKRVEAKQN
ncbi:TerC family protein [Candidatus Proelusimicrobium volucris]|uniref:TerC family protein n=1 Tax=Candidatus Proelusimicrobium volucris TaxID=3416225 RepID=UPI003D0D7DDD